MRLLFLLLLLLKRILRNFVAFQNFLQIFLKPIILLYVFQTRATRLHLDHGKCQRKDE